MPDEPLTPPAAAQTADAEDSGWSVESHSAPTTETPSDTTAATAAQADDAPPADEHGTVGDQDAGAEPGADDKASARGPKKKQSVQARIDEAIFNQREAERREAAARKDTETLQRRLEALEKGRPAAAGAEPGQPAAAAKPAADEMPEHPKYVDFDTEELYQAAVAKWKTDTLGWQTRREERLKTEITSGLDERLKRERTEVDQAVHEEAVKARIRAIKELHPDFDDLLAAHAETYAGITEQATPFIFDVIKNTADGAEFFYDLAKSPEMATALRELPLPTRALAHAVRRSPASRALMKYFATTEGRDTFMHLRTLQDPAEVFLAIGALQASLTTAVRGPASTGAHPITNAAPPAKPPVGTPRARESQPGSGAPPEPFDAWMAEEDRKEEAKRARAFGLAPASA